MEQSEVEKLKAELEQLKAENERLEQELKAANQTIRRAKNPNPWDKPTFRVVIRLARDCCMDIKKLTNGWLLVMGSLQRKFKKLKQIWELLTQETWVLSEIFDSPVPKKDAAPRLPKRFPVLASTGLPLKEGPLGQKIPVFCPYTDGEILFFEYANSS